MVKKSDFFLKNYKNLSDFVQTGAVFNPMSAWFYRLKSKSEVFSLLDTKDGQNVSDLAQTVAYF